MAVLIGSTGAAPFTYVGPNSLFSASGLWFWKTTAAATGSLATLTVSQEGNTGATDIRVGVFTDNAGSPGILLGWASTSTVAIGFPVATFSPQIPVVNGTAYWMAVQGIGGAVVLDIADQAGPPKVSSTNAITTSPAGNFGTQQSSGFPIFFGEGTPAPVGQPTYPAGPGAYEVRIVPLIKGVPGAAESTSDATRTSVTLAQTTLVEQFADVEVDHDLNEGRTGRVTLSMHDPIVAALAPFEQAVRIAYRRPGETTPESVLTGQCNVIEDYEAGTVTLEAQDPSGRCQHHYIRRGDFALNIDNNRGRIKAHATDLTIILEAAFNTLEQQNRNVPALALRTEMKGAFPGYGTAATIDFERGQEVWDLIQQVIRAAVAPDYDMSPRPSWTFPMSRFADLALYDANTNPAAPAATELGRNLDPVDPDNPAAGKVVFDYGLGADNAIDLKVTPGRPTTHVHVLDADKAYRVTSADSASSEAVGVFVDWVEADFNVTRPYTPPLGTFVQPADTAPLKAIADARVKAYGKPPKFFTVTLRPDDAQSRHYGHPDWAAFMPGTDPGGTWYIGDYVRVRAARGNRSFSTLARITGVKLRQEGSNGLPQFDVNLVPAIGGTAGADPEDA